MFRALLVVAQLLAATGRAPARVPANASDSAAILAGARARDSAFLWAWRFTWEASEGLRHWLNGGPLTTKDLLTPASRIPGLEISTSLAAPNWGFRMTLLHCHFDGTLTLYDVDEYVIKSGAGKRGTCPSWYPVQAAQPRDERLDLDADIAPPFRSAIRDARDSLLAALDQAAGELPGDPWLAGQRVRFALDQGDTGRALAVTTGCRAPRWWCRALEGYVRYGRGEVARADSLFGLALAAMPAAERCTWTDLTVLLDRDGQAAYRRIPCPRRDSINARIWWLADPLFTDPANERRVEHDARQVMIRIRSTITPSERYDWRDAKGGRAIREMLTRYGWPAFAAWAGRDEDRSHYIYLGTFDSVTLDGGIFTTNEYTDPRAHTVPDWSAVADPWHAPSSAWLVSMNPDQISNVRDSSWWPTEHYARPEGPLVQLAEQTALFRRFDRALLAVATDLPTRLQRRPGEPIPGELALSTGPDSVQFKTVSGVPGTTVVAADLIAARPQVASLEFRGTTQGATSVRTRLGLDPPPPLSTLKPGEIAISQPVIIHPAGSGELPPSDPDLAIQRMYGTTRIRSTNVGVFWETYGLDAGDTADVSVSVRRVGVQPGLLRRLAGHLGFGDGTEPGIVVSWREPRPGETVTTIAGPVPIQGRNVNLGIGHLDPGDYVLTVSASRPGRKPVSASRDFTILSVDQVR